MAIANTVATYLQNQQVKFSVKEHKYCESAHDVSVLMHIPASKLLKSILLEDQEREYRQE